MKKTILGKFIKNDIDGGFEFGNIESAYSATQRYFTYDGKPWFPLFGEFHFSRYDNALWVREIVKMKYEGLNGIAVYVFWNHHEIKNGVFDFEGDNDIARFLSLCKKHNMKVVLRIGPWCHGEVRYGGFPDYITKVPNKRTSSTKYMEYVKRFWTKLYEQVKDFCDGETIFGMQMENEYTGSIDHIFDLRKLCEEIGFKVPFFTMTKWPTEVPTKRILAMDGGYPEAPWHYNKKPLKPNNRFAIMSDRSDSNIGEDLIKRKNNKADFSNFPLASCELGTGNQVTAHRRPIISDKDGYGVGFAKFASGMNWMGYYMYHGGRNPNYAPMQESRITCYPNNYPMIDYDFQAAISKDGKVSRQGDRLRLMHTFINEWDKNFARTQPFFAVEKDMPYFSVRADERCGIVFVSNYERGLVTKDEILDIDVNIDKLNAKINGVIVPKDSMYFFPINCVIDGVKLDYITAQPIVKVNDNNGTIAYFMRTNGTQVKIAVDGKEDICSVNTIEFNGQSGKVIIKILSEEEALKLHYINGKVYFSNCSIYRLDDKIECELYAGDNVVKNNDSIIVHTEQINIEDYFKINQIKPLKLKYNYYMYSFGRRKYYEFEVNNKVFELSDDIEITLDFEGLNLQIFHNGQIVDDYFNINGKCVFRLARLKDMLAKNNKLIIRCVAKTRFGVGNPYNEIGMKNGVIKLKLHSAKQIVYTTINE